MASLPTIKELYDQILNDMKIELGITSAFFGKIYLRAQAAVHAARLKMLYLFAAKIQKNIFVDTADPESKGGTLERFGRVKLGRGLLPATAAEYICDVVGTAASVIPANTIFRADDDSEAPTKLYVLDNAYVLTGSSDQITLRALESGIDSSLNALDTLTSTIPLININDQVTVSSESVSPTVGETIEEYRDKIIQSFQLEPQGGSRADYRIWASDASGVRTVYPYAKPGAAGEINLYVEAETASSTDGKGTPPASMLTAVEDVVEFDPDTTKPLSERGRRPVSAWEIYFLAITPLDVDIVISSLSDSSASEKASITNAVTDYLDNIRPYIAGADDPNNINDSLYLSALIGVINSAISSGNSFTNVSFEVNGSPVTNYQFIDGNIPYLNSITYS